MVDTYINSIYEKLAEIKSSLKQIQSIPTTELKIAKMLNIMYYCEDIRYSLSSIYNIINGTNNLCEFLRNKLIKAYNEIVDFRYLIGKYKLSADLMVNLPEVIAVTSRSLQTFIKNMDEIKNIIIKRDLIHQTEDNK